MNDIVAPVHSQVITQIKDALQAQIIGQENLIESLLICLVSDGHILLESMPGLAKTSAAKALAQAIDGDFHRIQFTPDLLPADITGTDIYHQAIGEFKFRKGPLFQNIVLADEINRAPAKVQSALLEAMEEKQITVGQQSYKLPDIFMVIATQNPIEQEGTYNLPEAQLDRFLMHVVLDYPTKEQELTILNLSKNSKYKKIMGLEDIRFARDVVRGVYVDEKLKEYIVSLVQATRNLALYKKDYANYLMHGASVRATISMLKAAKACAWLNDEEFVLPEHIQHVAPNILRHRLALGYTALAEGVNKSQIIEELLTMVAIP